MPYKKVDITGEGTEVVDGGRGTPVDVVQEPTNELEKANTRFIASDKAPKKTVVDSDLQVLGKYYDKDGNELTRSELGDAITADEIDSENATSGKVLTADGDGGASWESVESQFRELTEEEVDYQPEGYLVPKSPDYQNDSKAFWFQYDATQALISDGAVGVWATRDTSDNSQYLYVEPYIKTRKIKTYELELTDTNRFTPATTGTITKAEADEYVKKIISGHLCLLLFNSRTYDVMKIVEYNSSSASGTYLVLQSYVVDSGDVSGSVDHVQKIVYSWENDALKATLYN